MNLERKSTRRRFLQVAGSGVAGLGLGANGWAAADGEGFRFVQLCDTQLGMGGYEADVARFEQAVAQINALKPDFVAICGDLVHNANDKSFGDFKAIRAKLTVPSHCVPGNHDVGNKPTLQSLARYREVIGEDYYAFDHKGTTVVCLNSQLLKAPVQGETEKQEAWLAETLAAAKAKESPVIVVAHYPWFLKSFEEKESYSNLAPALREKHLSLFEKHGVELVLTGHCHRYLANEYEGMQLVTGETTSKNFDKRPFGFRLWVAGEAPSSNAFVALGNI